MTIHTEMTDFHWPTCEPDFGFQNALEGLQDTICPSLYSDTWAPPFMLEADALVRSPSSLSEDYLFLKHTLLELQAESPPGSRAQHDDDDTSTQRSRSDTSISLNDWASPAHPAVQPLDHKLQCTYHDCTAKPFKTLCDFKSHMRGHAADVLEQWEEEKPCRCPWSGNCKSKAVFKSRRILQTHLENVHITPLTCTASGCSYRKPFRSNYDLKRHMLTAHSGDSNCQFLRCPYPKCDRGPRTFVRKDKWLIHIRTSHDGTECPINHCKAGKRDGLLTHDDLVKHIRHEHGKFECAIGACDSQLPSRFIESELLKHLEVSKSVLDFCPLVMSHFGPRQCNILTTCFSKLHHGLPYGAINTARSAVKISSDKTVKPTDVSSCWQECEQCKEGNFEEKSEIETKPGTPDEFRNHTLSFRSS
ncbi:uncharacterized protein LY89DRAFT_256627 [Mollisia scopiformis]|uniref:C2H2-type domain-containing protein n=1 Tax=Mollisia scopiformis TaxID=149040 RepID=A0A132BD37_MOLSC|nr:uncharacterized protein LY89DRAFT_256627 [Mollisia scopiformis]KUJ10281.1 hypothetical protein LY89DRAFT_256627 [Mollisia scopiformis]